MKIELRNVKYAEFNSEETHCFRATIILDGVIAGTVSNDGHGGPDNFDPWELEKRINEYAKTLPKRDVSDLYGKPAGTEMVDECAEVLIGDLLEEWLTARDLKKRFGKKILFTVKGKPGIFAVSFKQPQALDVIVRDKGMLAAFCQRHQADRILNTLPFEEALKLYREAA